MTESRVTDQELGSGAFGLLASGAAVLPGIAHLIGSHYVAAASLIALGLVLAVLACMVGDRPVAR